MVTAGAAYWRIFDLDEVCANGVGRGAAMEGGHGRLRPGLGWRKHEADKARCAYHVNNIAHSRFFSGKVFLSLEHFSAKWTPLCAAKMRYNKYFHSIIRSGMAGSCSAILPWTWRPINAHILK